MNIWICAVAKMEELYIREWIEWNKKIGVDHIVIGDNNDSDYNKPLCPIIQDYINDGYVEVINKNDVLHVQQPFYNEVYKNINTKCDWIGFIDIDEFIELPAYNNNIHLFLDDNKFKQSDAVILCWKIFNDNEQIYYENKPVKERFKKYIYKTDIGIKFFIKTNIKNIQYLHSIHNPINSRYINKNILIKCIDVLGNPNFKRICVSHFNQFSEIICNEQYYNIAYISHYVTKSTEEYIKYKALRGRCDKKYNYFIRYTKDFYFSINNKTKEKLELFDKYENIIKDIQNKELKKYSIF